MDLPRYLKKYSNLGAVANYSLSSLLKDFNETREQVDHMNVHRQTFSKVSFGDRFKRLHGVKEQVAYSSTFYRNAI